jgi:hypothetical protein
MKKKHRRTLDNVIALNSGIHWSAVEDLLKSELGAEIYEGAGSTVTFVVKDRKLTVDRPHPRQECGKGLVKRVKIFLIELEYIERDS